MASVPLDLAPTPGFCIKSSAAPGSTKVFVNICYDKHVPPPPPADDAAISRAMNVHEADDGSYYVPVVVSQPRQEHDKAGKPALVIDCVYNSTLRSRTLREPDFKVFLVELALQRIEAQTSLVLSRQIGTPNIVAKGKLEPRRVWVPAWIAAGKYGPEEDEVEDDKRNGSGLKLIEEIEHSRIQDGQQKGEDKSAASSAAPKLKGILKNNSGDAIDGSGTTGRNMGNAITQNLSRGVIKTPQRPIWTWKKEAEGQILIIVSVPPETPHEVIRSSTLDVEPRRLILHVPESTITPTLDLDVDLNKSDAEIVANAPENTAVGGIYGINEGDLKEPDNTLLLKRQKKFEVDTASAEWRVAEGLLVISV